MKVIFLDIDGVLNSEYWNESHQKELAKGILIDEARVRLFAEIINKTNAKIVLHSGWRFWFDEKINPIRDESRYLVSLLMQNGIEIYDRTPDLTTEEIRRTRKFSLVKPQEVLMWLQLHKDVESFLVIDDLEFNNSIIKNNHIKTDAIIGLNEENVLYAIVHLNKIS